MPRATLAALKAKDPAFSEAEFIDRAKKAFIIIQQAWMEKELVKASSFLSDGIYEQFFYQISEMREIQVIDFIEKISFISVYPTGIQTDNKFDVIHLLFNVKAINYRKDEKSGKIIDGSTGAEAFSEIWSFIRRINTKTSRKGGLIEGQCPNCGNQLEASRISICNACNAFLRSAEYDWVLTNISQELETRAFAKLDIPGLKQLLISDPYFNLQQLIERTSVIFWRLKEAEKAGKASNLVNYATENFIETMSFAFKANRSGIRRFSYSCVIGLIKPLAIAQQDKGQFALLEVKWSGKPAAEIAGRKNYSRGSSIGETCYFILYRNAEAKTKLELSFNAAHCPCCGAPQQEDNPSLCTYCQADLSNGKNQWALESIHSKKDAEVRNLLVQAKRNK